MPAQSVSLTLKKSEVQWKFPKCKSFNISLLFYDRIVKWLTAISSDANYSTFFSQIWTFWERIYFFLVNYLHLHLYVNNEV